MQMSRSEVHNVLQYSHYHLGASEQKKYNYLHFLTRHLISVFLFLQSVYLKKTMRITETASLQRLIYLTVQDEDELTELQHSLNNYKQQLSQFPFFSSVEQDYYSFFSGIVRTTERKKLLENVKKIKLDSKNLGFPSNFPFYMVMKINVQFYPLCFIPEPPCIEQSTRLLRYFGGRNFLRVEFKDIMNESCVGRFLRSGFLFAGRYWVYFGQASGQLGGSKEKSCWFCAYPDNPYDQLFIKKSRLSFLFYESYYYAQELLEISTLRQLKLNSCFFRYSCADWLGDFRTINLVCKIASRYGLCMGKSYPSLNLKAYAIQIANRKDFYSNLGLYSDGCGEISQDLVEQIRVMYKEYLQIGDDVTFTAFQFRYQGCKGMLYVNPLLKHKTIVLNDSYIKYQIPDATESQHFLEIVNIANWSQGYLNEQIIVLLDNLGVPNDFFINLLEQSLYQYKDIIRSNYKLKLLLERQRFTIDGGLCLRMLLANVSLSDIVMAEQIGKFQDQEMAKIQEKFRIKLPQSRFLYGVYDVLRVLDNGEVHISPSDTDNIQLDRVVVAKNPCTHPGNIRKLAVVDAVERFIYNHNIVDEKLMGYLKNMYKGVIVFPVAESQRDPSADEAYFVDMFNGPKEHFRPLSDQCGGSDLDGDIYFVTWDVYVVNNVTPVETQVIVLHDDELYQAKLIYHYPLPNLEGTVEEYKYLQYDYDLLKSQIDWLAWRFCDFSLGMIGKAHSIAGDIFGYSSPITIELSRCFNLAVDQDKNGWIMTYRVKDIVGAIQLIQVDSLYVENNELYQDFVADLLYERRISCCLNPHFYLAKEEKSTPWDILYHSTSIRGKMFDCIEKVKEEEFYGLKSFIMSYRSPFKQDERLYFRPIAEHVHIDNFYPQNSMTRIGVPEKVFSNNFRSVGAISRQFIYDVGKIGRNRFDALQEYYYRALFDGFSLNDCVARAIWFYFLIYEHCKQQFRIPRNDVDKRQDSSMDTSSEEDSSYSSYSSSEADLQDISATDTGIYENNGLFVFKQAGFVEERDEPNIQQVFSSYQQILAQLNRPETTCVSSERLQFLSIIRPSHVIFDARLDGLFSELDGNFRAKNYFSLEFRRTLSTSKSRLEQLLSDQGCEEMYEAEEEISELPEEVQRPKKHPLGQPQKRPEQFMNTGVVIYKDYIIVKPCQHHNGYTVPTATGLTQQYEFALWRNKKYLLIGRQCWLIVGKYLFLALVYLGSGFASITQEHFNMLRFSEHIHFK